MRGWRPCPPTAVPAPPTPRPPEVGELNGRLRALAARAEAEGEAPSAATAAALERLSQHTEDLLRTDPQSDGFADVLARVRVRSGAARSLHRRSFPRQATAKQVAANLSRRGAAGAGAAVAEGGGEDLF